MLKKSVLLTTYFIWGQVSQVRLSTGLSRPNMLSIGTSNKPAASTYYINLMAAAAMQREIWGNPALVLSSCCYGGPRLQAGHVSASCWSWPWASAAQPWLSRRGCGPMSNAVTLCWGLKISCRFSCVHAAALGWTFFPPVYTPIFQICFCLFLFKQENAMQWVYK